MSGAARAVAMALCAALVASCAGPVAVPDARTPAVAHGGGPEAARAPAPRLQVPELPRESRIHVPEGVQMALRLHASGAQIFRCEARGEGAAWVFRLPEADLADEAGQVLVRHGANYSFEHVDGSRVLGSIAAHDPAPDANDVAWLLLSTRSFGKGALEGVRWIQRIETQGGMPPPACDAAQAGQVLRVPFQAVFVFYR